jgi:hypothetical protein
MPNLELMSCRLAIQVRVGYFPDGRERHRTFSIKNISPDAGADNIAAVARALSLLLKDPVTKVRRVCKYRLAGLDLYSRYKRVRFASRLAPRPARRNETAISAHAASAGTAQIRGGGESVMLMVKCPLIFQ